MPRKYKKRNYRKKANAKLYKELGPLKTQQLVKFNYGEHFDINPGAGTAGQYVFSCNGLFDPNISGIGHQPRGFDQVMTLYDHYVVVGSKITVYAWNPDTVYGAMVSVHIQDTSTTTTDIENVLERRNARSKLVSSRNGGIDNCIISYKVNPNNFLGRSKPLSDPNLKGNTSANPSEQCYFVVSVAGMNDLADIGGIACYAKIEYTAVLIEPKQPTKS